MPFFFVTTAYLTMAHVPNQQMNNASAIFNLLRNLGGSFGVAFITTLLARRSQFHQNRLVEHLTPFDPGFVFRLSELKAGLAAKLGEMTDQTQLALRVMYREVQRQAAALAFNDVFFVQALIFLGLVGMLFIMRKPPAGNH
jgi:DHA2 family multidrug resistance protein